jgi:Spy/CpxP family protein refolding chaperone
VRVRSALFFFIIIFVSSISAHAELRVVEEILPEVQYMPLLGFTVQEMDGATASSMGFDLDAARGLVVLDVIKGSPADLAGIARGDVIMSLGDKEIDGYDDFLGWLGGYDLGSTIKLLIGKGGELKDVLVTLGIMPERFVEGYDGMLSVFKDCPMNAGDMHGCYWLKEAQRYDTIFNKAMVVLDLSAEQRRKARAIMTDLEKRTIRTTGEIKIAEVELRELLRRDPANAKKVRARMGHIGALWSELRYFRFMAHERFKKTLSAAQLKRLGRIRVPGFGNNGAYDDDHHVVRPGSIWPVGE